MTVAFSTTLRNARADAISSAVGNAGKLAIYDGSRPATGGTATNKLAEFTLGTPSGTATWARLTTSGGTFVADMSVGTSGSDVNLNTTTITSGITVSVTSWTTAEGNP